MRKPRDPSTSLRGAYDSELKALADKARLLKERRIHQLGELIVATGADVLAADALAGALLDVAAVTDPARQEGWRKRGAAFFHGKAKASELALVATAAVLRRTTVIRHRLEAMRARTDMREGAMKRRERTRHLIELGGLVLKAGLVDLADDDCAALYGAFLECAGRLGGDDRDQTLMLWRRRGKRAFAGQEPANDA